MYQQTLCYMCHQDSSTDGIKILGQYICRDCEKKLIDLKAEDIQYEYYEMMIKKIWENYLVSL